MSTVVGFGTFSALPQEQINKNQPPHSLRRPRNDRVVEHRGRSILPFGT